MEAYELIQGLIDAHELISDPSRHIRLQKAQDEHGYPCSPYQPQACKFDSLGAIEHVFRTSYAKEQAAMKLLAKYFNANISALNDYLSHDLLMIRWRMALDAMKKDFAYDVPDQTRDLQPGLHRPPEPGLQAVNV